MGLGALKHPAGWVPSTSGSEPGRTTGDADLGGYGGQPADPMSGNPNAVPQVTMPNFNTAMDKAYTNMGGTLPQAQPNFIDHTLYSLGLKQRPII